MGYEVGASGAFGLILGDYADMLGPTYYTFLQKYEGDLDVIEEDDEESGTEPSYEDDWRIQERLAEEYSKTVIVDFYINGIVVPSRARLLHPGTEDERPGRTDVPADAFILGFGLFTKPWDFPQMHESFRQVADWHTWVWGG